MRSGKRCECTCVDFSVVKGSNPVYEDWNPDLAIGSDYAVVNIQLVQGELLQDRHFITDFSQAVPGKEHHFRYCTLTDKLKAKEIAKIRLFIQNMLLALAPEQDFVWFSFGDHFSENKEDDLSLNEYYRIKAFCDNMHINGSLLIFEIKRDEIDQHLWAFCDGDLVRGIAIESGRMKDVLARLSLAEPIPTTQRYSRFRMIKGAETAKALQNLLEIAAFFFEEIDNGTRLRLVSRSIPREQMVAIVNGIIEQTKCEHTKNW